MKFKFCQRVAGVALGAALAALCAFPAMAWAWTASVPQKSVVRIERSEDVTSTETFSVWVRSSSPSSASYANGSFDATASGWVLAQVIELGPGSRSVELPYNSTYFLVTASDGCSEMYGSVYVRPDVNVASVGVTVPVSVSSLPSVSGTVAVSSSPPVTLDSSISVDGTLPVDAYSGLDLTALDMRTLLAGCVFLGGAVLGHRMG